MDAAADPLEQEKLRLCARLAEIECEQARRRGMFQSVPHYNEIEDAGRNLGRLVSRVTQGRLATEVAAGEQVARECPTCGRTCRVKVVPRSVTGLDGPTKILEPKAHCSACRRAFFPSA